MTYLTLNLSSIPRYTDRRAWREIWRWVRIVNKRIAVETHQSYLDIILRPEDIVVQDWQCYITTFGPEGIVHKQVTQEEFYNVSS